jgi:hypothetical protein
MVFLLSNKGLGVSGYAASLTSFLDHPSLFSHFGRFHEKAPGNVVLLIF